jgi:hypothetical protein
MELSGQLQAPAALPHERPPGIHSIEDWVGPRACPEVVEKKKILSLPGIETRPSNP